MARVWAVLLIASCLAPGLVLARQRDTSAWEGVQELAADSKVVVSRKAGAPVSGALVRVSVDSIVVLAKGQSVSVPRTEVARVVLRQKGHAKWIGLAIGAGAGAGIGFAVGSRIANESGGDFNLKGASTGAVAAAGALIGALVGDALDTRHSTVYIAR